MSGALMMPQKSPILVAIHRLTNHPDEARAPAGSTRLQHAILALTEAARKRPRGMKTGLPRRKQGRARSVTPLTAVAVGVMGSCAIYAAAQFVSNIPHLRQAVQAKWALVEEMAANVSRATAARARQVTQSFVEHRSDIRAWSIKLAPLVAGVLVVSAASAVQHRRDPELHSQLSEHARRAVGKTKRSCFTRQGVALLAAGASVGLAQSAMAHRSALGVPDSYKGLRRSIVSGTAAFSSACNTFITSKDMHTALLSLITMRALQQRRSNPARRRAALLPSALGALGAEFLLRRNTHCELPVGQLRARLRRARARFEGQRRRLRRQIKDILMAGSVIGDAAPASGRVLQIVATGAAIVTLTALERRRRDARRVAPCRERVVHPLTTVLAPRCPSPSREVRGLHAIFHILTQPELLCAGVAACEHTMRGGSLPGAEAVLALRCRAPSVKTPPPLGLTALQVKHALQSLWKSVSGGVASVPRRLSSRSDAGGVGGVTPTAGGREGSDSSVGLAPTASPPSSSVLSVGSLQVTDPCSQAEHMSGSSTYSPLSGTSTLRGIGTPSLMTPEKAGIGRSWQETAQKELGDVAHLVLPSKVEAYQGANPDWMLRSLVAAGVLPGHMLRGQHTSSCVSVLAQQGKRFADVRIELARIVDDTPATMNLDLFSLEKNFHHLNHGSYGATLAVAQQAAERWRTLMEASPSRFFEEDAIVALQQAITRVAAFVGARPEDCVPAVNATGALTALLRSLPLSAHDAILTTSSTYGSIKTAVGRTAAAAGASIVELIIDCDALTRPGAVAERLRSALYAARGAIRCVVLDHVVSFPPVELPVKELTAICREFGATAIIDGAHGIGNLDLCIEDLGADAYVTNCHKWLCAPKGTALVWVSPRLQPTIKPLVASHGAGLGFQAEHLWMGTSDVCTWLATATAVDVFGKFGESALREKRATVLKEGVELLLNAFGPTHDQAQAPGSVLPPVIASLPFSKSAGAHPSPAAAMPSMAALRLPAMCGYTVSHADASCLRRVLRREHKVEVPVAAWEGALWVRVSAAAYNCRADYVALARAIAKVNGTGSLVRDISQKFNAAHPHSLSERMERSKSQSTLHNKGDSCPLPTMHAPPLGVLAKLEPSHTGVSVHLSISDAAAQLDKLMTN